MKKEEMKNYKTPVAKIVELKIENAILNDSIIATGEDPTESDA